MCTAYLSPGLAAQHLIARVLYSAGVYCGKMGRSPPSATWTSVAAGHSARSAASGGSDEAEQGAPRGAARCRSAGTHGVARFGMLVPLCVIPMLRATTSHAPI